MDSLRSKTASFAPVQGHIHIHIRTSRNETSARCALEFILNNRRNNPLNMQITFTKFFPNQCPTPQWAAAISVGEQWLHLRALMNAGKLSLSQDLTNPSCNWSASSHFEHPLYPYERGAHLLAFVLRYHVNQILVCPPPPEFLFRAKRIQ